MLDKKLLQERLEQFTPEPLFRYNSTKTKDEIEHHCIKEDENNIDLAKTNFLDVLNNEDIKKASEDIIRKYGVGTCGPRAFYGTTDIHLELEHYIANWLGMEESIVYSYGFVAISSSVAAYCKRSDVVFIDTLANMGIIQGLQAARSQIVYFDHNDPESLREHVKNVVEKEKGSKKPRRKFLIVEGVSWRTGKLLPLPEFLEVAEEYKMRVFLEESYSIGVFGANGKGLTEHFNIEPHRLDMVVATLETAIGSVGGFCAGSHMAIEHQRLSGSGYIFSASLPTYLVQACIESIGKLEDKPQKIKQLAEEFHKFLADCGYEVQSHPLCPFKAFNIKDKSQNKTVHEYCKKNGVHFILYEDHMVINLNIALLDNEKWYKRVKHVLTEAIHQV